MIEYISFKLIEALNDFYPLKEINVLDLLNEYLYLFCVAVLINKTKYLQRDTYFYSSSINAY